jgi:hypothetical protein
LIVMRKIISCHSTIPVYLLLQAREFEEKHALQQNPLSSYFFFTTQQQQQQHLSVTRANQSGHIFARPRNNGKTLLR